MNFKDIQEKYLNTFESELKKSIQFKINTSEQELLKNAIKHSVTNPGKRIRPLICMAVEKGLNNSTTTSIPIGVAIELIHCYSLIHDDLPAMDNDDYRRGVPTCHKAYGEDIAILAGDTLNTYAFEYIIEKLEPAIAPEKVIKITKNLAKACGIFGMAGGQVLDLKSSHNKNNSIDHLIHIHSLKTGALLESCFTLPAIAITNDEEIIQKLKKVGQHFGLLFQIIDDILDEIGTLEDLGKSPGKDSQQNKLTFSSKLGLKKAQKYASDERTKAISIVKTLPKSIHDLNIIIDYIYYKGLENAH